MNNPQHYLYVTANLEEGGEFTDDRVQTLTERHKIALARPPMRRPLPEVRRLKDDGQVRGLVIEADSGWLPPRALRLARRVLASGRRVYVYWPQEQAAEAVNAERLHSFWRHTLLVGAYLGARALRRPAGTPQALPGESEVSGAPDVSGTPEEQLVAGHMRAVEACVAAARPLPLRLSGGGSSPWRIPGNGLYLRMDFWAPIISGGSYGHTCYVAKELARASNRLVCALAHRYVLLDDLGIEQTVLPLPGPGRNESDIVRATSHYHEILKAECEAVRPAYLYERLCLGNYTAVLLSQELNIPYIVEYNGSEISMRRSFDGRGYDFEEFYLKAEEAAFRQATLISVVSEAVKEDLTGRGVPEAKILVNPNGVDPGDYAPRPPEYRAAVRQEFGWTDDHCVVGFTGTFGGWHGIDVLAASIPQICRQNPAIRFLLIGDGNFKHLVDEAVSSHNLQDQVRSVGRVSQREGARLLPACDLYVSTHNSHMVDSRFFGSPTKIFEYMAMGGGIVATDLEQIGEVLSPALRPQDLEANQATVTDQRAVLCVPGAVDEFVSAVLNLSPRRDVYAALGRNARQAVIDHYSWERHVARLLSGLAAGTSVSLARGAAAANGPSALRIDTGDAYKDEVQNQWDNNPCGSHYVKGSQAHTLDWYLEAERYRYGEYAPWMPTVMEFADHRGEEVLEIGGGMGMDLAQFARHGASVTDLDLSAGHLALAEENFRLRGLQGRFVHHDAERLPFPDESFDLIYSNGVIHHTPNSRDVVHEMLRVLRPGGKAIVMVYAENSLHYWRNLFRDIGLYAGALHTASMGEIMSRHAELSENNAKPLVKVYTRKRLRRLFEGFTDVEIQQRQLTGPELTGVLRHIPLDLAGRLMGWNLVLKARKPPRQRSVPVQ